MDPWLQALVAAAPIALAAVLVLLFLIIKVKLHAFPALVLVSLLTALVAGIAIALLALMLGARALWERRRRASGEIDA